MRDHRRLLNDTAAIMGCSYFMVFYCAIAYRPKGSPRLSEKEVDIATDEAQILLDQFVEKGYTNRDVENFCLDVLIGKIPVFSEKGTQVNKRRKK